MKSASGPLAIRFPAKVGPEEFDTALGGYDPHSGKKRGFVFNLEDVQFISLDAIATSLCLFNQLVHQGKNVALDWSASAPSFGYCERMGYFEALDKTVEVRPERPASGLSSYEIYRDENPALLEISEVPVGDRKATKALVRRLTERLETNLDVGGNSRTVIDHVWTVVTELLSNIHEHSRTGIPGIMAIQPYNPPGRGKKLTLAIADSGVGMVTTIKESGSPRIEGLEDHEIILKAFREGLSRREPTTPGSGCGLTRCAEIAWKYEGNLTVRTMNIWTKLVTRSARTGISVGLYSNSQPVVRGTQIYFEFYLDRLRA